MCMDRSKRLLQVQFVFGHRGGRGRERERERERQRGREKERRRGEA